MHLPTIHSFSIESYGYALSQNSAASATYLTANRAFYIPVKIMSLYTAKLLFVVNGTVVSGNIDLGIYDDQGNRLVSSGSTAQSGTSALQSFNVTDLDLYPGLYYLAIAMDNTTGTVFRVQPIGRTAGSAGVRTETSAFPLPATATWSGSASNQLPIIGMTNRTFL